ncbi:MAG: aminotransferase class I/II-fold pyridoxal phosphate-dependent enzyme [Desulfobacterales bacterium]|nr:aminotransferase class I/II-fold pyridoxal phosphate-dependent enzyme [Desulfobacterales bacterium]
MISISKHQTAAPFELSPIKAMELAASRVPGTVSLAQGIPSFRTPRRIKAFAHEKIDEGLCDKYSLTNGLTELREEIALSLQSENISYDPESEILVTAGSIEGITATILALTEPGDEVMLPSPSYASYLSAIYLAKCTPRYVELDEENNFDFHVENIERNITKKTRLILYCSPSNPTGTLFSEEKTREMVRICQKHHCKILIDEVYKDFYYTDDEHFSPVLIPDARDIVLRACSFSKAYAMTGWRVGYIHGAEKNIFKILKYHDAMVTCAPVVSQYAAIAALRFGQDYLEEFIGEFRKRRNYCISRLDELSRVLDYQIPKAAYFVFPRIKDTIPLANDSRKLAMDLLETSKVAVVPGVAFGPSGESHIRINFGREMADLEEGFNRLADYLFSASTVQLPPKVKTRRAPETAARPMPAPRHLSFPQKAIRYILARAAKNYLRRNSVPVVGIAGTKGKTVLKRTLVELLGAHFKTRANILSYNTEVGLPISILNLDNPKTDFEKALFLARLFYKTIWGKEHANILILEYGVASKKDAETLLKIARPDWLIISGITTDDPHLNYEDIRDGIDLIASTVNSDRILWARDDALTRGLNTNVPDANGFRDDQISSSSIQTAENSYDLDREFIGTGFKRALIASVMMAEKLKAPRECIERFLLNRNGS